MEITFGRLGDAAVTVRVARPDALHADLNARPSWGVTESVPAAGCLTVLYDTLVVTPEEVERDLARRLTELEAAPTPEARSVRIPVTYDGPDLAEVARRVGLTPDGLIEAHSGITFTVAFLGFVPGFAYLEGLPPELRLPRRATPRQRVEAGSVAIGGPWAGVYPLTSPGGWHLLGRTATRLFDPQAPDPILLRPGDRVRFEPA